MARVKGRYLTIYLTDLETIKFLDGLKGRKENRNRFIVDLLRLAKQCQDEMRDRIRTVESHPLQTSKQRELVSEPKPLGRNGIIEVMAQTLQDWKDRGRD